VPGKAPSRERVQIGGQPRRDRVLGRAAERHDCASPLSHAESQPGAAHKWTVGIRERGCDR